MKEILLVALGGGLGAVARYKLGGLILHHSIDGRFPLSTFLVNVLGCLVAGVISGTVDGRNRLRACEMRNIEPRFVEAEMNGQSPAQFVLSKNLHRRHLNESQRAIVGARAKEMFAAEAKERKQSGKKLSPNLAEGKGDARDQAAKVVNVSHGSIDAASQVLAKGAPELVAAVEAGEVAVSKAAIVATLPKEQQRAAVSRSATSP